VVLAFAPAYHWFGSPWVKWAWVIFDTCLLAGLYRWLRRPNPKLLTTLAALVTTDAVITLGQSLVWNVHQARGWFETVIVFAVVAMPALASISLWGARARLLFSLRAAPRAPT
jgi:uncharacterized SAM-binding protein YcdF (DUF218 family)